MKVLRSAIVNNSTLMGLLALIVLFSVLNDRFLSLDNARVIFLQVAELGVLVVPLAFLLICGSVDLSVGSIASVGAVLSAMVMADTGSTAFGLAIGLGFGAAAGLLNGALVAYAGLNAIVVTLGFLSVWGGLALYLTEGESLYKFPDAFISIQTFRLFGEFPIASLVAIAIFAVGLWALAKSRFGRYTYALGGNERAAFLMGVSVKRMRLGLFVLVGLAAALSGILLSVKLGAASPTAGKGLEIQALTVILLGGVSFAGGSGKIGGVLAGLFFVGVLQNGLIVIGTSQFLQQVFLGAALLFAVAINDSVRQLSFLRR